MSNPAWGLCKDCEWWQIEPNATVENHTIGECIENKLQRYTLRIAGNGGCSRFHKGSPARAEGSSDRPPTAKPMR